MRASALNTRELMQQLKPVDLGVGDLPGQLASAADRFRRDTSIDARFVCDLNDVQIAPRTGRESSASRRRRWSTSGSTAARATSSSVSAPRRPLALTVDDDGKGFEFEGRLTLDELDAEREGRS